MLLEITVSVSVPQNLGDCPCFISLTVTVGLFGTELEQRAEYEGNRIPNVVQKCIQEVEIRGMDFEGIYRKSGGASQMRQIQDAFERGEDPQFDSNVDICGVTSVLKQYFRNLPNPLLTYEIYERFVETTSTDLTKASNRLLILTFFPL